MLLEVLVSTIGFSVAKGLLNIWLKDDAIPIAIGEDFLDLIKNKSTDIIASRKGKRFFEELGDKVATSLEPLFESYNKQAEILRESGREESFSVEAVALEVSTAIEKSRITSKLLAKCNNSPNNLLKYVNQTHTKTQLFSELENDLYSRALDLSTQYIVDLAPTLPGYSNSNFSEILERLDAQGELIDEVLKQIEDLQKISEAHSTQRKYIDFEHDYRGEVIRKFDKINLFGADIRRETKRYKLSIAYVSLDVTKKTLVDKNKKLNTNERLPVEVALANSRRSIIVGEAGSGKTTLLQWLTVNGATNKFDRRMIDWKDKVPFLIELRHFAEKLPAPEEFVSKILPEIAQEMPETWVHEILRSGRAILLIDGVDEIPSTKRETLFEWLENIIDRYTGIHIVISSRPTSYKKGQLKYLKFEEFHLAPMDINETQLFIKYWHKAVLLDPGLEGKEHVEVIIQKLTTEVKNSLPLSKLATNPLLCAIICALFYEKNMQLPSDRITLYEDCCSMLIERRDLEKEVHLGEHPKLTYKQKRVLIDDLAYWMVKNGYVSFSSKQAIDRIDSRLPNMQLHDVTSEKAFHLLIERSGMFRELSTDTFDFIHKTFQEYMAACSSTSEGDWGLLVNNATDDLWKETIILAIGMANKVYTDQMIEEILLLRKKKPRQKAYLELLAVSCLDTAVEVSTEVRNKVEKILKSIIPPKKREQINSLVTAGDLAVPYLGKKKTYTEDDVVSCIEVLSRIGSENALKKFGEHVKDNRPNVINSINAALSLVPSEIISKSGLAKVLLESLDKFMEDNHLSLSAHYITALEQEPISAWKSSIPSNIKSLRITDANESCIYILDLVPEIRNFSISGYDLPSDISQLSAFNHLISLKITNRNIDWPRFFFYPLKHLYTLSLIGHSSEWPNFRKGSFPKLSKLELIVRSGGTLPDLDYYLPFFDKIKHLHLGAHFYDFDLDALSTLENLQTLELSLPTNAFPDSIFGIEHMDLKDLILNVDKITPNIKQYVLDLKMGLLNTQVALIEAKTL